MEFDGLQTDLSHRQFSLIAGMVYDISGIKLASGKESLVQGRLAKRLRALGMAGFDQYLDYVCTDRTAAELHFMVDALTTNKTSFFREHEHFDFLRDHILPRVRESGRKMRIWSAACSTGEEPYSIAMLLKSEWPNIEKADVRILATDISSRVLKVAREGVYSQEVVSEVAPALRNRYFSCEGKSSSQPLYRIKDDVRALIRFARLNLMADWPMTGPFDVIFCRNVMIYFDKETQQRLVQRFFTYIEPEGYLLVGHSESLTALSSEYSYVLPATYRKRAR